MKPISKAEALVIVKRKWDSEGYCDSCSWSPLLSEYGDTDDELMDAFDIRNGRAEFCCISKDDEDACWHRGIRIWLGGP